MFSFAGTVCPCVVFTPICTLACPVCVPVCAYLCVLPLLQAGLRLLKAGSSYVQPRPRAPAVANRMAALIAGGPVTYTHFDSRDDQHAVVGKRIAVLRGHK